MLSEYLIYILCNFVSPYSVFLIHYEVLKLKRITYSRYDGGDGEPEIDPFQQLTGRTAAPPSHSSPGPRSSRLTEEQLERMKRNKELAARKKKEREEARRKEEEEDELMRDLEVNPARWGRVWERNFKQFKFFRSGSVSDNSWFFFTILILGRKPTRPRPRCSSPSADR